MFSSSSTNVLVRNKYYGKYICINVSVQVYTETVRQIVQQLYAKPAAFIAYHPCIENFKLLEI
jgi:hypothetical protein